MSFLLYLNFIVDNVNNNKKNAKSHYHLNI